MLFSWEGLHAVGVEEQSYRMQLKRKQCAKRYDEFQIDIGRWLHIAG
jgi:hypothetical protein